MNVRDLMKSPQVCGPADTLEHAARILWEHDCGVVPVVDEKRRVIGMITDRDICMAAWTKGRTLGALPVHGAMARINGPRDAARQVTAKPAAKPLRKPAAKPAAKPAGRRAAQSAAKSASR